MTSDNQCRLIVVVVGLAFVLAFLLFGMGAEDWNDVQNRLESLVEGTPALTLEEAIVDGCVRERAVDLSRYEVTFEELDNVFDNLRASGRLPWYTSSQFRCRYNENTGIIAEFVPLGIEGADKARYEQRVAEILEECVLDGMNEYQIALALHDYLIVYGRYDESLTQVSGYDLLVEGTAVCSGYATAYQDLLIRAGLECVYVSSAEMKHMWNLVKIDGHWYHVDLTWDDPRPDVCGYVSHNYFLLTDSEILSGETPHYGWEREIVCDDERFMDGYWRGVDSRICFVDSDICYLVRTSDLVNSVFVRDDELGEERLLYKGDKKAVDIGSGKCFYGYQGLSLWDGRLYFTTVDRLLSMDLDGDDVRVEHKIDLDGKWFLRGSFIENGIVYLSLSDSAGRMKVREVAV